MINKAHWPSSFSDVSVLLAALCDIIVLTPVAPDPSILSYYVYATGKLLDYFTMLSAFSSYAWPRLAV